MPVSRTDLGLPEQWGSIEHWLEDSEDVVKTFPNLFTAPIVKNTEIPVLTNYLDKAPEYFWKKFPKNFEEKTKKTVKIKTLKNFIQKCWFSWTLPQRKKAKLTLRRLQGLEKIKLKRVLPAVKSKNANSATKNGIHITDSVCSWVKKGYVMGPFKKPPLKDFRINPLMAAVQKNKVRPILNMSAPKGNSLNDVIDMECIEKLNMSSPRIFARELRKAGKGALFSKTDIVDAYKLIPNAVQNWRLFGFTWLGRYFFDKTKVFGSREAPASFDSLPETIVNIVCCMQKISKTHVQRQLDDVPMVASKDSGLTEKFTAAYKDICSKVNIPLANDCPAHEKAFGPTTFGTVLGINFDSSTMEWSISNEKELSLQEMIDFFLTNKTCSLKQIQKLHGKLANFSQSMDYMQGFRFNILALLNKFEGQEGKKLIPAIVKKASGSGKKLSQTAKMVFLSQKFLMSLPFTQ